MNQRETEIMLELCNTLTRKLEVFQPAEDRKVKMYTCGPSTYQRPHIGNYRTFLFEDVLQRYLEYLGFKVSRLVTLTNIEDKAVDYAEVAGVSVDELTDRNEAIFFKDFELLRIKPPDYSVRASTIIDPAVKLIQMLMEKGIAYKYTHEGAENIYYDPLKFKGFGKLAHLNMRKWPKQKRRFHLDTYQGSPWNRGDFVLWRGCRKNDKVCWDTDIGRGRPAWNIQDAAMVTEHLGFQIDVACGGVDNLVRHHDYTIAVAEAVSGKPFANYWLHGGHLCVDGEKMSKSKGNVLYPEDLTEKGYSGEHIRFFLIYGRYRQKQNFTWENLAQTSQKLDALKQAVAALQKTETEGSTPAGKRAAERLVSVFETHMNNDLDLKSAFDAVQSAVGKLEALRQKQKLGKQDAKAAVDGLRKVDQVLQVIF
ncbi:MAG: class I tRNA ligase family protein [Candidatus Bathyarchaeota archaeon]|nr:class I tRNA ligase family protein [Candidatus Bathyarchaeota archaeon]